jgi:tRNA dimethylallyltransferase
MGKHSRQSTGKLVIVAGPTASGKSGLALALAEAFDGIVINADSMQLYRELRILTARPGAASEARVPHRLYGIWPAAEPGSAARWRRLALAEIEAAWAIGRLPVLVGGTGLYLQVLREGLAPVPDVPAAVRDAVRHLHRQLGAARFHAALAERDPLMAARLNPGDTQRLIRAFEVLEATGSSLAEWQARPVEGPAFTAPTAAVLLEPPRPELYARCDARFLAMLEAGALDEVRALDRLGLDPALPAMKALGVPELRRHLAGEWGLAAAVAAAQKATRHYAKRQSTWFRHRAIVDNTIRAQFSESFSNEIFSFIRQFILTLPA